MLLGGILFSLRNAYYATDYLLHKSRIIERFCENKDKPLLNCDGKCYLAKKLNARYEARRDADHAERQARVEVNFLFYFFENPLSVIPKAPSLFSATNLQYSRLLSLDCLEADTPPPRI